VAIDIDRQPDLAREWNVEATPTLFVLDAAGEVAAEVVGALPANELGSLLRRFAGGLDTGVLPGEVEVTRTSASSALTYRPKGFRGRSICFSHVGYGPLKIPSQSVFQALRSGIQPRTPSTLSRGEHELRGRLTWANMWANDNDRFSPSTDEFGRYFIDFETLEGAVAYAYGLSDVLEIEVELEQRWRFGGAMDGFIQGFHDLIGVGQNGRDLVPRNDFRLVLDPSAGLQPPVDLGAESAGLFSRTLLLTFQHNVTCGTSTWPAVSYAIGARTSIGGTPGLEGRDFDAAVSLAASRRFGNVYVYLTLGYAWYGSETYYDIELERQQLTVLAASEWRFKPRMSLVLQYLYAEGAAVEFGPFSEPSNEVVVGLKWEPTSAGVLEVGLIENVVTFDNSPDFGIHAGWTQRF
jgi:hypothetical protein